MRTLLTVIAELTSLCLSDPPSLSGGRLLLLRLQWQDHERFFSPHVHSMCAGEAALGAVSTAASC
jgi:hypothetical protein